MNEITVLSDRRAFFTDHSLADLLQVSDRQVRRWMEQGVLPYHQLGDRRRIDPADVDTFLAERRVERSAA